MQSDENKRKGHFLQHIDGPEKIRKNSQTSSRFVDTLIGQWSKCTGMQISSVQEHLTEEYLSAANETENVIDNRTDQDLKIQILEKKLQEKEKTIVVLSSNLESELSVKDEISDKLASIWESTDTITNYCNYMSESMKAFQEHINHLTTLYKTVIETQKNTVEQQEKQLHDLKGKDAEHQKYLTQIEGNLLMQEKKIQELISVKHALEQEAKGFEEKLSFEKNYLVTLHTEEKLKLINEHEMIVNAKDQLELSLKKVEDEKNKAVELITEKEFYITKLQEKMNSQLNEITSLSSQNADLKRTIENLKEETGKALQEKSKEIQQLLDILNETRQKEDELTEDIRKKIELCESLENNLLETKNKLEKADNTIELLQSNENTAIIKLHKTIETLQNEKAEMYTQHQTQIQHIKQSQKNLLEKQEMTLKEKFKTDTAEMRETIEQLKHDITKLNDTLTGIKVENNTLKNNIFNIKESNKPQKNIKYNSVDKEKNQMESKLKEKYMMHQKELALAEQEYKSAQVKLNKDMGTQEDTSNALFNRSQSQLTNKFQSKVEEHTNQLKITTPQKKSTEMFDAAKSQSHIMDQETESAFSEKKFFKLRSTQVRRYGNKKNKIVKL